ncbi:MAG TPA: hypothetical protein DCS11_05965 [Syntrophus sp. (in: bacteria)]|nr:hypothetical protein [Syntrophus sp. (in: bacteria)]
MGRVRLPLPIRQDSKIFFWRTVAGGEVDWVIETERKGLPIENASASRPVIRDAANLLAFQGADRGAALGVVRAAITAP